MGSPSLTLQKYRGELLTSLRINYESFDTRFSRNVMLRR